MVDLWCIIVELMINCWFIMEYPKNPWIPHFTKLWFYDVGWWIIEACEYIMSI